VPLPSRPHGSPHGSAGAGHWPPAPFSSAVSWRRCQTRKCSILPTILTGGKSSCFPSLRNLAIFLLKFGIKLFRTTEFLFSFLIYPDYTSICAPTSPPPPDYGRLLVDVLDRPVWRRQRRRPILLPTPGSGSTGAGAIFECVHMDKRSLSDLRLDPARGSVLVTSHTPPHGGVCKYLPFLSVRL